jgi:drug/metabolite transporter (DMT)-like permease
VGAVLLLVGAMLQITRWELSPILYTIGAMMFAYVQVMSRYEGKNLIVRRLRRQQILGAVLLVFAGVLMFVTKHNEWVLCLTIAAILELYTAFRIPSELEKEK